jgi:hypothetical protein
MPLLVEQSEASFVYSANQRRIGAASPDAPLSKACRPRSAWNDGQKLRERCTSANLVSQKFPIRDKCEIHEKINQRTSFRGKAKHCLGGVNETLAINLFIRMDSSGTVSTTVYKSWCMRSLDSFNH